MPAGSELCDSKCRQGSGNTGCLDSTGKGQILHGIEPGTELDPTSTAG